ncbi:UNKNOWN [Stylonychia lemnae]|uniref:Uncharacterized protein n=1 Tax=Stylonychia lemnae TaxID=5949 RepID=A0A078BAZ1_STYLE|nr:UNKNOWN [Stylonychia lemnae]|eukprot:CDW90738.1 UNKNOWN [Stylonychia lemnae]
MFNLDIVCLQLLKSLEMQFKKSDELLIREQVLNIYNISNIFFYSLIGKFLFITTSVHNVILLSFDVILLYLMIYSGRLFKNYSFRIDLLDATLLDLALESERSFELSG